MKTALSRLCHEYRLQIRLIVGHWSYWVMHLVFAVLMMALFGSQGDKSAQKMLSSSVGTVAAGLILLVCVLLSGMAASRNRQSRFVEMAETYPTGSEILLAGYLAVLTAGLGLLLEPLALAAYIGPLPSLAAGLFPFFGYVVAGAALGSAFTWWLAGWMKFQRWIYPLLAAAWAGFWLGPMFLARAGLQLPLIDIPTRMQNADYDELFGLLEPKALSAWFCIFIFCLAVLFIILAFWKLQSSRFNQRIGLGFFGVVLALGLCVFSAIQFYNVKGVLERTAAQNPDYFQMPVQPGNGRIEAYDATVDMITADQPIVTVKLTLRNEGNTGENIWNLALNHNFKVISCSVPYVHDQDSLQIQLPTPLQPRDQIELKLAYQGAFTTYSQGIQIPIANQFLSRHQARLGLYSSWLPVAGRENLIHLTENGNLTEPVSIHLTIRAPKDVNTYSNLTEVAAGEYFSPSTTWLYWVASPRLASSSIGELQVFAAKSELSTVNRHAVEIEGFYRMMQSFFPEVKTKTATLLAFETRNGMPILDGYIAEQHPILIIPRIFFSYWDQSDTSKASTTMAIGSALVNDFYQLSGGSTMRGAEEDTLGRFLWIYYECGGDAAAMRQLMGNPNPLKEALLQVVEQSGREGLLKALDALRNAPADSENLDMIAAWLKASLNVR